MVTSGKKIIAIVQARMGSVRLPGKPLMEIEGKPMLWHVVRRLSFCKTLDGVVLSLANDPHSDALQTFAQSEGIPFFRGSEHDVLSRFQATARHALAHVIARVTGDNPLVDPALVDCLVQAHLASGADYTCIDAGEKMHPLACEVFNADVLEQISPLVSSPYDREHVTPYLYRNEGKFKVHRLKASGEFTGRDLHLTVDTQEDLQKVRDIYKNLYHPEKIFHSDDIINFLMVHAKA